MIVRSSSPKLLNRVDAVLDRAKLYTDESVISSTETHLSGYTTDWQAETVYNLRTGDKLTLDEAVDKGILDARQVLVRVDYVFFKSTRQSLRGTS